MKTFRKIIFYCLSFFLILSCSNSGNYNDASFAANAREANKSCNESMYEDESFIDVDNQSINEPIEIERKIIKTGDIAFETANVNKTRELINRAIKQTKSYVSADNINNYDNKIHNTLTIKVPADKFEILLDSISCFVEYFDKKSISANDVTEEYVDIQARLKTKKDLEQRYVQILAKANSVSEILEVERQLSGIREQIESVEGRMKYLEKAVSFSTLNIDFYKKLETSDGFGSKFVEAFSEGWGYFVDFCIGLIYIWPFLLLTAGIIVLIIYLVRKKRNKRNKK